MKPLLIVQNDPVEGAGGFSTQMSARGIDQDTVLGFDANFADLKSKDYAGLVLLGGAQGAYETEAYPYLLDEIALCQDFLSQGRPIVGFCLGAQLLACALGGIVEPGKYKEIGWYDVRLSKEAADDPLLTGHPEILVSLHFHGDYIREVPGGIKLASSALTPIQLFRYGDNAYGFQYHAEVDAASLELMCRNNRNYLESTGVCGDRIIDEGHRYLPDFERQCRTILDRWLDLAQATR